MRQRLGVNDRVSDLIRLLRDKLAPDCIALRPEILSFVVEPSDLLIDDDAERHAVKARDDTAVELGRARVERDGVAATGIADGLSAVSEQLF